MYAQKRFTMLGTWLRLTMYVNSALVSSALVNSTLVNSALELVLPALTRSHLRSQDYSDPDIQSQPIAIATIETAI